MAAAESSAAATTAASAPAFMPSGVRGSSVQTSSENAVVVTTLRYTTGWITYIMATV